MAPAYTAAEERVLPTPAQTLARERGALRYSLTVDGYEPVAVDLDPGLSNPIVAVTLAICCVAFAGSLVLVARSPVPVGRKARRLMVALVVGSLASKVLPQMVNGFGTWAYTRLKGQHPSIGVVGNSPG